jgi:hypothetical protein
MPQLAVESAELQLEVVLERDIGFPPFDNIGDCHAIASEILGANSLFAFEIRHAGFVLR